MKFISLLLFLLISMMNLAIASGGGGGSSPFIPLNPPIIVNIMDGKYIRHMQVIVEIKAADQSNTQRIEAHKGPIRHELILLLSSQDFATISSPVGKEGLRKSALAAIQKVLGEIEGDPLIDALYFTNFIIQ